MRAGRSRRGDVGRTHLSVSADGDGDAHIPADECSGRTACCNALCLDDINDLVQVGAEVLVEVHALQDALVAVGIGVLLADVDGEAEVVRVAAVLKPFAYPHLREDGGDGQLDGGLGAEHPMDAPAVF